MADKKERAPRTDTTWLHPYRDITIIGLDTPHKSLQEHCLYDPRIHDALKTEDIDSVRKDGVLANAYVRRDGQKYDLVDGRGRTRRARVVVDEQIATGIPVEDQLRIPCTVVRGDDVTLMMLSRTLNSGRSVDSSYRNGEYAQELLRRHKTIDEIAVVFGVSVSTVRNWISLLDLGPEAIAGMETGLFAPTTAVQLSQLSRVDQAEQVAEIKADLEKGIKPTAERITDKVRAKLGKEASKTPRKRCAKATEILKTFADSYDKGSLANASRADLSAALDKAVATLDKVSRALADVSLAKLAATGD